MEQNLYLNGYRIENTYLPRLSRGDMELIDLLLRRMDQLERKFDEQYEELREIKGRLDRDEGEHAAWGKVWGWFAVLAVLIGWVWEQIRLLFLEP